MLVQDVSNWSSLLTINKGTSHGVEKGECVVTEAGYLVGVVTEAGYNWSTVRHHPGQRDPPNALSSSAPAAPPWPGQL